MRIYKFQRLLSVGLFLIYFCIMLYIDSVNSTQSLTSPLKASHILKNNSKHTCGPKCLRKTKLRKMVAPSTGNRNFTNDVMKGQWTPKPTVASLTVSPSLENFSNWDQTPSITQLIRLLKEKRRKCKAEMGVTFYCQKLQWFRWLLNELDKNSTALNQYVELVRSNSSYHLDSNELLPENGVEKYVYKIIRNWGDPIDRFMFHKLKQYTKSTELKVKVPYVGELQVSPRRHELVESVGQGRTFWDPGFNLKMKLPFFRDELKFAVSTGPSFIAGLGVGFIFLAIKSLFGPFILAMKYMMYSIFFKDASPYDMMKMLGFGSSDHVDIAPPSGEHYEAPHVHNHFDNLLDKHLHHHHGGGDSGHAASGGTGPTFFGGPFDQGHQFSQMNPIIQQLSGSMRNPKNTYIGSVEEGRRQVAFPSPTPTAPADYGFTSTGSGRDTSLQVSDSQDTAQIKQAPDNSFQYIPSAALQLEVENYDPFYSPLLSRIDSIFMHLGFTEEGCRERAVCSIYKFPVKYAPYSNLLSAQLSKHQSELKRPVSSSLKILRYFKYMKAAKDGQGNQNCIEMYPKCDSDTEKISSLPMVKTFHQLTELMGGPENTEA